MFKIKWYTHGKDGKELDQYEVAKQSRRMEALTKQLKRDKMHLVSGTDDGFAIYDSVYNSGIKSVKSASNAVKPSILSKVQIIPIGFEKPAKIETVKELEPVIADNSTIQAKGEIMNKITILINGVEVSADLNGKTFSTGSTGFNACGKLKVKEGERYQFNINAVLIGSKPKAE